MLRTDAWRRVCGIAERKLAELGERFPAAIAGHDATTLLAS